uniref:Putative ovule protein n=1 Tax=Solanum chacoense TaxID=4108 RepID=A0A0V0IIF5_SOLCH
MSPLFLYKWIIVLHINSFAFFTVLKTILNNLANDSIHVLPPSSKIPSESHSDCSLFPVNPTNSTLNLFNLYTPTIPKIVKPLGVHYISHQNVL